MRSTYKAKLVLAMPDSSTFETELITNDEPSFVDGFVVFYSVQDHEGTVSFNRDYIIQFNMQELKDA